MAEQPLVSAIIPVYNGAPFIADAIDSVLRQTYPHVECVVVDDGSTDATPEILRSYGGRVTVVTQPNCGVSAARNAGVAAGRGVLLAFLDADDIWLPEKLDRQVAVALANPRVGLVYSGFRVVDVDGNRRYDVLATDWKRRVRGAMLLEGYGLGFAFTGMITREASETVGPFDVRLSTSADLDYVWRVSQKFLGVGVVEPLSLYRQHGRSQMHNDLRAFEHDVGLIHREALSVTPYVHGMYRRAQANAAMHLAIGYAVRGRVGRAARHTFRATVRRPDRVLLAPAEIAMRRLTRLVWRRWPLFVSATSGRRDPV